MPPSMLDGQLAALEEPTPDERAWVCDVAEPLDVLVAALVARTRA
jgi:gluconate kinase